MSFPNNSGLRWEFIQSYTLVDFDPKEKFDNELNLSGYNTWWYN